MTDDAATKTEGVQPSAKEAFFFLHILSCMKNKPEIDWDEVATKAGLSTGKSAYTRFGQIKKKLGWNNDGGNTTATASTPKTPKTATPRTPRAKKEKASGSGTNKTPTKVTKPRAKKGAKAAKSEEVASGGEDDMAVKGDEYEDDEDMLENQFEADLMNGSEHESANGAFDARADEINESGLFAADAA